jgi:hypothetical protein
MPEKKDSGYQWRQTPVIIRDDIFLKAVGMGLDISHECNQALAHLTAIDYSQQQLTGRVMKEAESAQNPKAPVLNPVINADDPTAVTKVIKAKRQPPAKPIPEITVRVDLPRPDTSVPLQILSTGQSSVKKGKATASEKKGKEGTVKKFVTTKITRTDADDAVITKDDMYQAFTRWCRDYRCATVPERKAFATLLKNKFAITEKTVKGNPCWVNVQLR